MLQPKLFGDLFRALDRRRTQALTLEEFLFGCSLAARGSYEQKMSMLFLLFDGDEDRIIERDETMECVATIGRYMIKEGSIGKRYYGKDLVAELFPGQEQTMTLERFKQRGAKFVVIENCTRFFDSVFFPIVDAMEMDLCSAQLFGRPVQYTLYREQARVPVAISALTTHLLDSRNPNALELQALFGRRLDDQDVMVAASRFESAAVDGMCVCACVRALMAVSLTRGFRVHLADR